MAYAITDVQAQGRNHVAVTFREDDAPASTLVFPLSAFRQSTQELDFVAALFAKVRVGLPEKGVDIKAITSEALRTVLVGADLKAERTKAKVDAAEAALKGGR